MSKPKQRPHLARCVLLTRNLPAAHVLYRLMFWKPTRVINGRKWIAKTHDELMFETALTLKQVKTGVAMLRKLGFIQTEQHQFYGRSVNHYLVTETFLKQVKEVGEQPSTGPVGEAQTGPPG